jgi:hypothetical protein
MKILLISALFATTISVAHSAESQTSEAQAVNSACSQESMAANCGSEKVGSGLIKCIRAYKREHKEFKLSESCKSSMKKLKTTHSAKNAAKAKSEADSEN